VLRSNVCSTNTPPADTVRGKLFPFNQQSMRFNISTTSSQTVILVPRGWIQTIVLFVSEEDTLDFTFP